MNTPYNIGAAIAFEKTAVVPFAAPLLAWGGRMLASGLAKNMIGGAVMGGGLGALTAAPGERLRGGLQGAGYGALGGAVWHGAGAAMTKLRGAHSAAGSFLGVPTGGTFSGGPMSNALNNTKGFKGFMLRNATRPGVVGMAASSFVPIGPTHKPDPMAMSNLPPGMYR